VPGGTSFLPPRAQQPRSFLFLETPGTVLIGTGAPGGYSLAMTATERDLLATLRDLEQTVLTLGATKPKPNLLPLFARLDQLTAKLPRDADPSLLHYLHRKSYEKARLLLEGRDKENQAGSCRH
jgi:hypothetical protein